MIVQQTTQRLHLIGAITTGDGKWKWKPPYAGELLDVTGYIKTLGSGAGTSTDVQIRNATKAVDMLSTVGAFEVNSATNLLEGHVVSSANYAFSANDVINLDVDATSTSPADAVIDLLVILFVDDV